MSRKFETINEAVAIGMLVQRNGGSRMPNPDQFLSYEEAMETIERGRAYLSEEQNKMFIPLLYPEYAVWYINKDEAVYNKADCPGRLVRRMVESPYTVVYHLTNGFTLCGGLPKEWIPAEEWRLMEV